LFRLRGIICLTQKHLINTYYKAIGSSLIWNMAYYQISPLHTQVVLPRAGNLRRLPHIITNPHVATWNCNFDPPSTALPQIGNPHQHTWPLEQPLRPRHVPTPKFWIGWMDWGTGEEWTTTHVAFSKVEAASWPRATNPFSDRRKP